MPDSPQISARDEIAKSKDLDLCLIVDGTRPARFGNKEKPIKLVTTVQPSEGMRARIVWLAEALGYRASKTTEEKTEIAEAASRIVFYDCGFRKAPRGSKVKTWMMEVDKARYNDGVDFGEILKRKQRQSKQGKYTIRLERDYPGYLHAMFRRAGKEIGFDSSWNEPAEEMNKQLEIDEVSEGRPVLKMTNYHIR